jgi:hypothetical protein
MVRGLGCSVRRCRGDPASVLMPAGPVPVSKILYCRPLGSETTFGLRVEGLG